MTKQKRTFGFIFLLLLLPTACGHRFEPALKVEVRLLQEAVQLVSVISSAQFELAENANRLALQSNLNLQFDLGGRPDVQYPALFSAEDRKIRRATFANLIEYSARLNGIILKTDVESTSGEFLTDRTFSGKDFSKLGTGSVLSENALMDLGQGLDGLSSYLFTPHSEEKLAELMDGFNVNVEKAAFLLFLDIGGIVNSSKDCGNISQSPPAIPIGVADFPECRSGLRAVTSEALEHAIKTMRLRLKLAAPKELREAKSRPALLDKIYQLEQLRSKIDERLVETRIGVLGLAALHRTIAARLSRSGNAAALKPYLNLPAQRPIDQGFVTNLETLKAHIQISNEKILSALAGELR